MSTNFEQMQIQFSAHLASLQSKVKALTKLLTPEQIDIYNGSILKDKEKFLEIHPDITEETQEKINKFFS